MSFVQCCRRFVATMLLVFIAILLFVTHSFVTPSASAQALAEQAQPIAEATPTVSPPAIERQTQETLAAYRDVPFVPGELLVGFYHGDTHSLQELTGEIQAAAIEQLDLRGFDGATGTAGVVGQRIRVPVGEEWATMQRLLADPSVAFAEPNWLVFAAQDWVEAFDEGAATAEPEVPYSVNDPLYADEQWYLQRINASHAWALIYNTDLFSGPLIEVQVAIVDSGIDVNHPEFRTHLLDGKNYVTPGTPPDDDFGHGTHVAGLLGAVFNNSRGIAGVAPKVRIDPRKALNSGGGGTIANVSQAIRDAADAGADIINLSLEAGAPNAVMEAAVQYAASKGSLLIAASGNSGITTVSWPAHYDEVMAIAATTYNDTHANYSNSGPEVDIAAPGGTDIQSMISTWPGEVFCKSTGKVPSQSDYCTSQGTSMAAAVASGAAAMLKSLRPSLTAAEIRQILRDTAQPLNEPVNYVGRGRLDLQAAARRIISPELQFSRTTFARDVFSGTLPYTVTLRLDNPSSTSIDWRTELVAGEQFVTFHDGISNTLTSTVAYGDPVYLTLTISPTHLISGSHAAALKFTELLPDGTERPTFVDLSVLVWPGQNLRKVYFPTVIKNISASTTESPNRWEFPATSADRKTHLLLDNSNIQLSLPFTFTLRNQSYLDARLYADGFLRFSDSTAGDTSTNHCLPDSGQPDQAIYGWWADLDPSAPGAKISSFQSAADTFVVEFSNVPSAASVTPTYVVSFQMVLYANGDIRLNYDVTPELSATLPNVTVGVEARNSLFFNQVACKDGDLEVGYLPQSRQSILFRGTGDVY